MPETESRPTGGADALADGETTDLRFGKTTPDESDPCEHSTHMGSPVVVTAIGDRGDVVREVKVCSACQTVFNEDTWENGHGVVIEGEGRTLMRRTNVNQDNEATVRIPLDDVLDRDPDGMQVNHVGVRDGELLVSFEAKRQQTLATEDSEEDA